MEIILKSIGQYGFPIVMCLLIYLDIRKTVNKIDVDISNHVVHRLDDIKNAILDQTKMLEKKLDK